MTKRPGKAQFSSQVIVEDDGSQWCPSCGCALFDGIEPRSIKQLGMFHAYTRYLEKMWPTTHDFQPEGATEEMRRRHIRAWLTVQAKHLEPSYVHTWSRDYEGTMMTRVIMAEMEAGRKLGRHGWLAHDKNSLHVIRPASISIYGPQRLGQKAFNEVSDRYYEAAYRETGIDVDDWKENRGGAFR